MDACSLQVVACTLQRRKLEASYDPGAVGELAGLPRASLPGCGQYLCGWISNIWCSCRVLLTMSALPLPAAWRRLRAE